MSQKIIRSLYESRLAAWAAARSPALPIAYQNLEFPGKNPDGSQKPMPATYLRAFLLPAETDSLDLAGDHRLYQGLFQVSIVAPTDKGAGAAEQIVNELVALFPLNLRLTKDGLTVQVITPASQGPSIQESISYMVPVSFRYRADAI